MAETAKDLVKAEAAKLGSAEMDGKGIVLRTATDLKTVAEILATSGMCPQAYNNKPKAAMVAILAGQAVGLEPMQALQGIAVINGRPSMYGDALVAVAQGSGKVEWIRQWFEIDGKVVIPNYPSLAKYPDNLMACWQTKRKDAAEDSPISRFSVSDAKVANLWGKNGPWSNYPQRMLGMRASSWGLRANYADALSGISSAEEMTDIEVTHEKHALADRVGPAVEPTEVPQDAPESPEEPQTPDEPVIDVESTDSEPEAAEAATGLPGAPPCARCKEPLDHTGENTLCLVCQGEAEPDGDGTLPGMEAEPYEGDK